MKKQRKRAIHPLPPVALAICAAAVLVTCYPSPDLGPGDYDTVITMRTEGAEFGGFRTYAVPDTVISRPDSGAVSDQLTDLIVGDIHRNMQKLGYDEETDPETSPPDVVVVAGAITRDQYGAWLGYPWFGWWGWYGGGAIGYPGSHWVYQYTQGTVTMDMFDFANFDPDSDANPVLWSAAVSGPLQQNVQNQTQRVTDGIDRAFEQSPYLKPQ
jgi:hypothetical protein